MKRVAIITNIPAPYRVDFFDYLQKEYSDYEFTIIYSSKNEDNRTWIAEGKSLKHSIFFESRTIKIRNGFDLKYIHFPKGVGKVLNRLSPDVVIASEYNPTVIQTLFYCKRKKIPMISWTDGTLFSERNINLLQKFFRRLVVRNASAFIASSTKSKEAQLYYGAVEERCHVSYLTVDVEKYLQKPQGKGKGKILCVGRLEKLKGIDLLFKAVATIKSPFELYLAGDGEARTDLENLSKRLGIEKKVHFLGMLNREELLAHYADSDIFVLPTRQDCFALVILEAMCSGLPIVCSKFAEGAWDMIKEGENGFIVDPYCSEELSMRIEQLLCDEGMRIKMQGKSDEIIEKFRFCNVSKGYLAAIDQCLERIG